jgi:hypothetical protein
MKNTHNFLPPLILFLIAFKRWSEDIKELIIEDV